MDNLSGVTQFLENRFRGQIKAHRIICPVEGCFSDFPPTLHPVLQDALKSSGIDSLYQHQAESFESISGDQDTVLVSQTASGKTLSFLLPVLNEYMNAETPFGVMLLYPTKALSRDQENTLGNLIQAAGAELKVGTFDGDTPREERKNIQRMADFVITNPDMLHAGILPNHNRNWKNFLSRLKYIIVDEVHTYRGAFGSHVSNVFRRLGRICETHGSSPVFICSSATVGNPAEHVEALFHRPFKVISSDGAPRPRRDLYFINPPLVQSQGGALYRKGPGSISVPLIREATLKGIRTICFCRARQEVERLYRAITDGHSNLKEKVKPYRGGLLPNERRKLERDLFSGEINTIISTNALELGIDIGDLDLCILSGHPGTIASFWQQSGRVGRKGTRAVTVFISKDTPVDQYMVNHPEFVTEAPIEEAWLNADNPYILLQHLPCAAHEHPLRPEEPVFPAESFDMAVRVLTDEKALVPYHECHRYALQDYPAKGVNLRGMTDYNVEIVNGSTVIGELDPIGARGTLYKDAIYQHLGKRYMSLDLDLEKKICKVEPVNVDYYTQAVWENRIEMTEVEDEKPVQTAPMKFGYIHVNIQPKMYKKIRERTFENVGYGPITLPPFEYDTTGFSLFLPQEWKIAMDAVDKRFSDSALYGLSYLLRRISPVICMADTKDIETDVSLQEREGTEYRSALYLYDSHEGGVGYAEKVFERIEEALDLCHRVLSECECESGCPSCVPPLPAGVNSEELEQFLLESNASVECTRSLLTWLLEGELLTPNVVTVKRQRAAMVEPEPLDEVKIRLERRMVKASQILRKKKSRTH